MCYRKKIAFIVSSPTTADAFLRGHVAALRQRYEVDLIANFPEGYESRVEVEHKIHVPVERKISPLSDLSSLLRLIKIFKRNGYDAVHSVTPKAGLLGMIAARVAGVKVRHHTFTGQVWVTRRGLSRLLLRSLDKLVHKLTTHSLVDSGSQKKFLVDERVVLNDKTTVLGNGSISGVDINRFKVEPSQRKRIRRLHGIKENEFVFLFLGRINPEKGIRELIRAFERISINYPYTKLLVVGRDESGMFEDDSIVSSFKGKLIRVGYTCEPEAYFNAADTFCLPSHREGFGSVLIEAAACGATCIASNIYGITDAVIDRQTGLLHTAKSEVDIFEKMELILNDAKFRAQLANAAQLRAREKFSSMVIENALVDFYERVFESKAP